MANTQVVTGSRTGNASTRSSLSRIASRCASFVRAVFFFRARDYGNDPKRYDQHDGLKHLDGSRKPAFRRWSTGC